MRTDRLWDISAITKLLRDVGLRNLTRGEFPLFDEHWYRASNPDVAAAGIDPIVHYLLYGAAEGRAPHPLFDPVWYYETQATCDRTDNALLHFLSLHKESQVTPTPLIETGWYVDNYPNSKRGNAFVHFVTEGHRNDCDPNPWFDTGWYRDKYAREGLADNNPLIDYVVAGAQHGRDPSPRFCTKWYLDQNPDVARSRLNPLVHYLRYGRYENRSPRPRSRDTSVLARMTPPRQPHATHTESKEMPAHAAASSTSPVNAQCPQIAWIVMADNHNWAYGNNARRLIPYLPEFSHAFDGRAPADIAFYFDIKIFHRVGPLGRANVLRVGGPRPVRLAYEGRDADLARDLAAFDAVIVLNAALFEQFTALHPTVYLIPNGIDTAVWAPQARGRGRDAFRVGFAGNISTASERRLKGHDLATAACARLGVPLRVALKGQEIAHDDMRSAFYGEIDALVHPVREGKEGCSNVIMEAMALGIPVVTTRYAGFHAERLEHGVHVLLCEPTVEEVAEKIAMLRDDPGLARRIGDNARAFAVAHHDLRVIASRYREVFAKIVRERLGLTISFVPFGEPPEFYATGRLRCLIPAAALNRGTAASATVGYSASADVYVVSQLASDVTMARLRSRGDAFVIYDVCDRYHADDRTIQGVRASARFRELAEIADVVVTSSVGLKAELASLGLAVPIVYIPDGVDYPDQQDSSATAPHGPIVWFGYPGRGNFTSAKWILDSLRDSGHEVFLISRKRWFSQYPAYQEICQDWSPQSFVDDLRRGSIAVITHSIDEPLKSANRLITAVANGVPAIVATSPACEELLRSAKLEWAIVSNPRDVNNAVERLRDAKERADYLSAAQRVVFDGYGEDKTRHRYEALLKTHAHPKRDGALRSVLFVSHNMNIGEGAPKSLFQLVCGLRRRYGLKPTVFCPIDGPLREAYEAEGVEVIVSHPLIKTQSVARVLSRKYDEIRRLYVALLQSGRFDAVVANTAKGLAFADVAAGLDIPVVAIVRESSAEHVHFTFAEGGVIDSAEAGLRSADAIVFVSRETQKLWDDVHELRGSVVIPNGIDVEPWAPMMTPAAREEARKRLGIGLNDVVLLSIGTISTRKGQGDIITAFATLPDTIRDRAVLALVGAREGVELDRIRVQISELPFAVSSRVRIMHETPDVATWYRASDVFVLASYNESYPRVVMEALYFGLPVVATNAFGSKEQVIPGACGELFEPGDTAMLGEHLRTMIADTGRRERYAERARMRFFELVTYDEMLHRYYALLVRACAQRSRPVGEHRRVSQ